MFLRFGKMMAVTVVFLMVSFTIAGEVFLNKLFTDNMVLQRDTKVPIYGRGDAGDQVNVAFDGQSETTKVGPDGKWMVVLKPMVASAEGTNLTVVSAGCDRQSRISITNILVGDVWFCSGQSNMDRPFMEYSLLKNKTAGIHDPMIRLYVTSHEVMAGPQEEPLPDPALGGAWQECSEGYLNSFSPTAYYFGARLQKELNVPIGLIESSWGGTRIESWMPEDLLLKLGEPVRPVHAGGELNQHTPSALYDTMVHPFRKFNFKGIIWYQGESNSEWPVEYGKLFPAMIESWREKFGRGNIPFYYVQLAPFKTLPWNIKGEAWAWLRASQAMALKLPRTGMVVTTDIGEYEDIHPQAKESVGERLALWALRDELCDVPISGPRFSKMKINEDVCMLWFAHTEPELAAGRVVMNRNPRIPIGADKEAFRLDPDKLHGFTICGEDRKFVEADARIAGSQVVVWNLEIKKPVAVRYGWSNFPLCNLFNKEGLPASPFRTDDFPSPGFHGEADSRIWEKGVPLPGEKMAVDTNKLEEIEVDGCRVFRAGLVGEGRMRYASFRSTNDNFKGGKTPKVTLSIVYFDRGKGFVDVVYDSGDQNFRRAQLPQGVWKKGGCVKLENSETWRVADIELEDALFSDRCNGYDIRLESGETDYLIESVYLKQR